MPCHFAGWFVHPKRMPRLHLHSTNHYHTPANPHTNCDDYDHTPANDHDYDSSVCSRFKENPAIVVCRLH